jgi:uncharacterized protein YjbI with pentapeptide repeats
MIRMTRLPEEVARLLAPLKPYFSSRADLTDANLICTTLTEADFSGANLSGANLTEARLRGAQLLDTNLEHANLENCRIYGISAWNLKLEGAKQVNLVITQRDEPIITVDDLRLPNLFICC